MTCLLLGAAAAGSGASTPSEPPHGLREGVYVGHYVCGSSAWLLLHVEAASAGMVNAVFHFVYPSSTQHGAFELKGSWVNEGRVLRLVPGDWLDAPPTRVVPVGIAGVVSGDGSRFKGEVLNAGCGGFDVNLTRADVAAGATVDLGDATLDLPVRATPASGERPLTFALLDGLELMMAGERAARKGGADRAGAAGAGAASAGSAGASAAGAVDAAGAAGAAPTQSELMPASDAPEAPATISVGYADISAEDARLDTLEATLLARIAAHRYAAAYDAWRAIRALEPAVVRDGPYGTTAARVMGKAVAQLTGEGRSPTSSPEHFAHVVQTLGVFGGVTHITRSLLAFASFPDAQLATQAEAQLRLVLDRSGTFEADALLAAADGALAQGRRDAASRAYGTLFLWAPTWAAPHARLARMHAAAGEYEGCARDARAALEINPNDVWSRMTLGECLDALGKSGPASEALREVRRLLPTMAELQRYKGRIVLDGDD